MLSWNKKIFGVTTIIVLVSLLILFTQLLKLPNKPTLDDLKTMQYKSWGIQKMGLEILEDEQILNNPINIAVLDSGIDFNHSDFEGKIKDGYNAIEPKEKPFDDNGHGTLVTGILAAQENSIGTVGIIPHANIYPIKVLDEYGEGDIHDIVEGIQWCIDNQMDILNMSFSFDYDDPLLRNIINKALKSGIIIVASAMNNHENTGYPASYNGVISVVAVDEQFDIYKGSSIGKVDFSAPGVEIYSTGLNNTYEETEGNSIATPHVTGIIGLVLSQKDKTFSRTDIMTYLNSKVVDLGRKGYDTIYGNGFVQFDK